MHLTIWHDDDVGLPQMNEWLAELRDESRAEPANAGGPPPQAPAAAPAGTPRAITPPQATAPRQTISPRQASPPAPACAGAAITERAVIGDQLRRPVMWCEMASCISCHSDPAALGEADARARAIRAGWCIDGLGWLACPRCQQTEASGPPARSCHGIGTQRSSRQRWHPCVQPPQSRVRGWHPEHPAHPRMPGGRHARSRQPAHSSRHSPDARRRGAAGRMVR